MLLLLPFTFFSQLIKYPESYSLNINTLYAMGYFYKTNNRIYCLCLYIHHTNFNLYMILFITEIYSNRIKTHCVQRDEPAKHIAMLKNILLFCCLDKAVLSASVFLQIIYIVSIDYNIIQNYHNW